VTDLGERLRPVAESLLGPDEELRGCCVATQSSLFKGRMVAIVVTDGRLIVQGMNRRFEPDGEPLSLPPERIADAEAARRGPLAGLGGGEVQRQGAQALGEWFARHADQA
jgi:hypothetical protein